MKKTVLFIIILVLLLSVMLFSISGCSASATHLPKETAVRKIVPQNRDLLTDVSEYPYLNETPPLTKTLCDYYGIPEKYISDTREHDELNIYPNCYDEEISEKAHAIRVTYGNLWYSYDMNKDWEIVDVEVYNYQDSDTFSFTYDPKSRSVTNYSVRYYGDSDSKALPCSVVYDAEYNKNGDLQNVRCFTLYETCCITGDEFDATYDGDYHLVEYDYDNRFDPLVRLRRRLHHYF